MAVKQPEFWLAPEFLAGDDVPMEQPNLFGKPDTDLCFPAEFPHDLCSSPAGSAETESEEERFLTELTRCLTRSSLDSTNKSTTPGQNHFEKWLLSGGSGMSSGSSNGTPNGSSQISSPTTLLGAKNDAWDLILQAAGQVAMLKLNGGDESLENQRLPGHRTFPPLPPAVAGVHNAFLHEAARREKMAKRQSCAVWDNMCYIESKLAHARAHPRAVFGGVGPFVGNGRYGGGPVMGGGNDRAAAMSPLQFQQQNRSCRPVFPLAGVGIKRERAGTGVFLPRRYGNNPVESGTKKGCCATTARVVQGLKKNIEGFNGSVQPRFNGVFLSDYDMLIARRNAAMLAQQRRSFRPPEVAISREVCLPQEWTY